MSYGASSALRANVIRKAGMSTPMIVGQSNLGGSVNVDDLPPQTYTLQFGFAGLIPPDTLEQPTARAIILWKVDGQPQRRVISIGSGAAISGVCNGVSVQIEDVPLGTPGLRYSVQATLSAGMRGNVQQPPVLMNPSDVQQVAATASVTINLLTDAGIVAVYAQVVGDTAPTNLTDINLVFFDSLANQLGAVYPLVNTGWVPLPPGTTAIQVNNDTADNVQFRLLYGVEG